MNSSQPNKMPLRHAAIAFAVSVALGAAIPILRKLICGDADPFQSNWPLFLHAAASLAAFVVSWRWRQRAAPAIGISVGLAGYLLIVGKPEYPAASMIALAIHGFIPALVGSLIGFAINRRSSEDLGWVESSRPTNPNANAGGSR